MSRSVLSGADGPEPLLSTSRIRANSEPHNIRAMFGRGQEKSLGIDKFSALRDDSQCGGGVLEGISGARAEKVSIQFLGFDGRHRYWPE